MTARSATIPSFAKINLSLKVLGKRPDGYHELRTVFQTITLHDTLEVKFAPARSTHIRINSSPEIPDNLVVRAARLLMETCGVRGALDFRLTKRVPMGAGLGGGSSNAAAVLLALPALTGVHVEAAKLAELASALGSDVPFFLEGGAALGIDRGTEVYPLPDVPALPGVVAAPQIHVPTSDAYQSLGRTLTSTNSSRNLNTFRSFVWSTAGELSLGDLENDFEAAIFHRHPLLGEIKQALLAGGARSALMTGSGSAVFGLFSDRRSASRARRLLRDVTVFPMSLLPRGGYRKAFLTALKSHTRGNTWPPRSRYAL